jgi:protease IV
MSKKKKGMGVKGIIIIVVLAIFAVFSFTFLVGNFLNSVSISGVNVAKIYISGPIMSEVPNSLFSQGGTSSTWVMEQIKLAEEDPFIYAIYFEINSPGGGAVPSKEIVEAIRDVKKPTVSYIREVGASGAYWAASATDHIISDELAITGSIGVLASYVNFAGLLDNYNVSYERLVGGKYKDIGSPMKELTSDERNLLQGKIDKIHEYFMKDVARNRNISFEEIENVATGIYYLGTEALDLNLVDEVGGKKKVEQYLASTLGVSVEDISYREYIQKRSFWQSLSSVMNGFSYSLGNGIGSGLTPSRGLLG